ncbi:MAG: FHA domain-containing protein [Magnetococcales bacterium]|nr:FHA domain-containing protein [Magnetococcales bacterium]
MEIAKDVTSDPIDKVLQLLFPDDSPGLQNFGVEESDPIDIDKVLHLLFPEDAPAPQSASDGASQTPKEAELASVLKQVPGFETLPKEFLQHGVVPYIKQKKRDKLIKGNKAQAAVHWDNLIKRLRELNVETKDLLQSAKDKSDLGMALNAIERLEQQIKLESKLLGDTVQLLFPEPVFASQPPIAVAATASAPQATYSGVTAPQQEVVANNRAAIMFADITESAKLNETVGSNKAREITSGCIQLLSKIALDNQGVVVKTVGVEALLSFPSADAAAKAAVQMQQKVADSAAEWGIALNIRVGFHFGYVSKKNNDVSGEAVNITARIVGQAKGGQIITTGETLDIMSNHLSSASKELIQVRVKGKADPIRICELTWVHEKQSTTQQQPPAEVVAPSPQPVAEKVAPSPEPTIESAGKPKKAQVIKQAAIMFADIAGSTKLYEAIGDEKARSLTSACIDLLKQITEDHQGIVIKTIGDEVMCTFPTADLAAEASIRMQEDVDEHQHVWGSQLHIRVGFHYGDVIEENNDVFGDAVNLAARMAGQAKGDQIITTGETLDIMSDHLSSDSRELIKSHVKGKAEAIRICELTWGEEEELTIMGGMDAAPVIEQEKNSATISYGGKDVVIDESNTGASMGRGDKNTFMVPDSKSSRAHAKFEFRRGRIYLIDQSSNGTYVSPDGGQMVFIHRDEHILQGTGVIGLGHEVNPAHELAIHYNCG